MDQQRVLQHILKWAAESANIRLVALTGSTARGPECVDPLSDVDVELFVGDPTPLLDDDTWYARFGEVLVVEALPNPGWHPTRLVYYVDGKIDFMIAPVHAFATTRYERCWGRTPIGASPSCGLNPSVVPAQSSVCFLIARHCAARPIGSGTPAAIERSWFRRGPAGGPRHNAVSYANDAMSSTV